MIGAKFTKGPWYRRRHPEKDVIVIFKKRPFAKFPCMIRDRIAEVRNVSDARLVTQSPELYDMVRGYTTLLRGLSQTRELTSYEQEFLNDGERILDKVRSD